MTPTPIDTTFTLTALELGMAIGTNLQTAGELLAVAVNEVERYAPLAPGPNKREAVIRFSANMLNASNEGRTSETFGPKSIDFVVNHSAMFRNSGAAALLTRWKRPGAGARSDALALAKRRTATGDTPAIGRRFLRCGGAAD